MFFFLLIFSKFAFLCVFFGFTKATQPKNQRTKAHQPWQQLTPSACILVEHPAHVALSVATRTDNDGILILIVNLISHNFFFFSVCVFVRKGKPRAKRCFHMGKYYGMIFIVSGIWPKTTAKKLARKKHISSISCLTDEIGRTPLLEWWHSLVRFPNCIVYYQSRGWGTWLDIAPTTALCNILACAAIGNDCLEE